MQMIQDYLILFQNKTHLQHEDLISLLIYLSQQPPETIIDFESTSKLIFYILSETIKTDFNYHFLQILNNLKNRYFSINNNKVYVHNNFMTTFFLISLKYKKTLFISPNDSIFVCSILQEIVESICLLTPQSSHLLRLLEMILKKREDVLTPDLSLLILKSMNKAAYSPLIGFKSTAQNVSRILIRSLPFNTRKYLCNFNNLPIKGIDLNDILKQCNEKTIRNQFYFINKQILKWFCNNTDSRDASFFYETVTNICNFDEFVNEIWPFYSQHFDNFNEGEFYQSFLKYWIPITIKRYQDQFYTFIATKNVDCNLKAYTLLEVRKKGFYSKKFNPDALTFLKYSKTSSVGLKIISIFIKKQIYPDRFDLEAVKLYLIFYSQFEFTDDVLKNLKQFFSQIFFVSHMNLSKNDDTNVELYSEFLSFICRFCIFLIDKKNFEVSSQILRLIWDIASGSSSNLITCYKLDRENVYESGENLFYRKLQVCGFWREHFLNKCLIEKMNNLVRESKHCSLTIQLIKNYYLEFLTIDNFVTLGQLLVDIKKSVWLQSSEKIRAYTDLFISYKKSKNEDYLDDVKSLCDIFANNVGLFDPQNMFVCVLILDMLIVILGYDDVNFTFLLNKSLIFFEKIFTEGLNSNLNVKDTKILESYINNYIECLRLSKSFWSVLNKEDLLRRLCIILELSNMKRPVSLTASFLNYFGSVSNSDEDTLIKIKLLDRTLNSLCRDKQSGKIRRNPETRLVIHALCLSDKNLTKLFLFDSLNFMLGVLANPLSTDRALSSTLHSLEVLVSDNSIHQLTLPFTIKIIKLCVSIFNKPNWIVRNADLQLLKSLIERFLGVSLDDNTRPKTIEDLFTLFPDLITHFYKIISSPKLNDDAIIVLLFFSESQIKNHLIVKTLSKDFNQFKHLFANIIKNYSNNVSFLAIKAFTSLCLYNQIPNVFTEIVNYIKRHFLRMNKNVFANLIKLLQELYKKFKLSFVQIDFDIIRRAVNDLINYLKHFNCFYFNLLSLRLCKYWDIKDIIAGFSRHELDYKERIFLNNYIPFVTTEMTFNDLGNFLNSILNSKIPEFLQIEILSILVDKSELNDFPTSEIIKILILKLLTLSDSQTLLITAYSKCLLLFYESVSDLILSSDVISRIRQDFSTNNIYKVFIYVLALAHCDCKIKSDNLFLTKTVNLYTECITDDEISLDLSATIIHLYQCIPETQRYEILKLVFYLLLNESTAFEMCKFMSWLTQSRCLSVFISFVNLLKISNLLKFLGDGKLARELLIELHCYVNSLPDELEQSDTYYLIETDCSIKKEILQCIIVKSLEDCDDFLYQGKQ